MKIMCNSSVICELNDTQKKVICNDIPASSFEKDMMGRMKWIMEHKYGQCLKRLREEWEPRLKAEGAKSIPCDDEEFCSLVFSRPDYKDREARDKASESNLNFGL